MKPTSSTTISVAQILTHVVGSRDLVDSLRPRILQAKTKAVVLDFQDVEFISRSAAHEFLTMKEDYSRRLVHAKQISFANTNKSITDMFKVVAASRAIPEKKRAKEQFEHIDFPALLNQELI